MENKTLRAEIVRQKNITICSIDFWKRKFNIDLNNYFSIARKCTKETKLRWLHLRLVHNIYPTNILLKKMYLKDTNLCDTCNNSDFIEHAFYHCEPVQRFWNHVSQLISTRLNIHFNISPSQAILGIPMGSQQFSPKILHEINHIILIAKLSIVKSKVSKNTNIKVNFEQEIELRKKYFQIIECWMKQILYFDQIMIQMPHFDHDKKQIQHCNDHCTIYLLLPLSISSSLLSPSLNQYIVLKYIAYM